MSHERVPSAERNFYLAVRVALALGGAFLILITLSSEFLTPGLLYDEAPGPPPLRNRLPGIALSIGIGILMCAPHRWTTRGVMFRVHLVATLLVSLFLLWWASQGRISVRFGDVVRTLLFVSVAVALPVSLWWSKRLGGVT